MLYRQHFQASIAARHPGVANPEISKIIGRQWREESQEIKDNWDALAEVCTAYEKFNFEPALITSFRKRRQDISNNIHIIDISLVAKVIKQEVI